MGKIFSCLSCRTLNDKTQVKFGDDIRGTTRHLDKNRSSQLALQRHQDAVVVLQSWVRCYLQRRRFQETLAVIVRLQQRVKAVLAARKQRRDFLETRRAVCIIQATWKMSRQKQIYYQDLRCIVLAQAAVRRFVAVARYGKLRQAVVKCQKFLKCRREAEKCRREYVLLRSLIVSIQAAVRGHLARKQVRARHAAATLLQARVRGMLERQRFRRARAIIAVCQRMFRATLAMRKSRDEFVKVRQAAVTLQSAYRGHRLRKDLQLRHEASMKIQTLVRSYLARKEFKQRLLLITFLQAQIRGFLGRRRYQKLTRSVVVVQKRFRAKILGETLRQHFLATKEAVTLLQSAFKRYRDRTAFKHQVEAVRKIQAHIRGYAQRQIYQNLRQAAMVIQRRFRRKLDGENVRYQFLVQKGATITLQAVFRGYRARQHYRHTLKSVTKVQALVRGYFTRRGYKQKRQTAIVIQNFYRAKLVGENIRFHFLIKKGAAITLQALFRSYRVRKDIINTLKAVTKVQALVRSYLLRKKFLKLMQAAIAIQRTYRANTLHKSVIYALRDGQFAATVIQTTVREYVASKQDPDLVWAANLRASMSRHIQMSQEKLWWHVDRFAALVIQTVVRGYLARKRYLDLKRTNQAAVSLQRSYRSYQVRQKRLNSVLVIQYGWLRELYAPEDGDDKKGLTEKVRNLQIEILQGRYTRHQHLIEMMDHMQGPGARRLMNYTGQLRSSYNQLESSFVAQEKKVEQTKKAEQAKKEGQAKKAGQQKWHRNRSAKKKRRRRRKR